MARRRCLAGLLLQGALLTRDPASTPWDPPVFAPRSRDPLCANRGRDQCEAGEVCFGHRLYEAPNNSVMNINDI